MKFQVDSDQHPTKLTLGMYSKEDEYVSFSEPCDCSGQGLLLQQYAHYQQEQEKVFDNMAKMKFQVDSDQHPTKLTLGMYSKEDEYVRRRLEWWVP
ncbi:UNVERIFIED_CONTAM: hypothetical protein K2H54_004812 [Gekko kuhli]